MCFLLFLQLRGSPAIHSTPTLRTRRVVRLSSRKADPGAGSQLPKIASSRLPSLPSGSFSSPLLAPPWLCLFSTCDCTVKGLPLPPGAQTGMLGKQEAHSSTENAELPPAARTVPQRQASVPGLRRITVGVTEVPGFPPDVL